MAILPKICSPELARNQKQKKYKNEDLHIIFHPSADMALRGQFLLFGMLVRTADVITLVKF